MAPVLSGTGTVRQELYNLHIFDKFAHVRELVEGWQRDYNENRPHKGLKYKTPLEYARANMGEIPIGNCPNFWEDSAIKTRPAGRA